MHQSEKPVKKKYKVKPRNCLNFSSMPFFHRFLPHCQNSNRPEVCRQTHPHSPVDFRKNTAKHRNEKTGVTAGKLFSVQARPLKPQRKSLRKDTSSKVAYKQNRSLASRKANAFLEAVKCLNYQIFARSFSGRYMGSPSLMSKASKKGAKFFKEPSTRNLAGE